MKKIYMILLWAIAISKAFSQERGLRPVEETRKQSVFSNSDKTLKYDDKYAILIGIDDYKSPDIQDLSFSTSDAIAIGDLLVSRLGYKKENVTILLDSMATRKNIIDTMSYFIRNENVTKNSQLLFYYAGHGTTVKNSRDQSSLSGFLLTYDSVFGSEYSTSINMDELRLVAEKSQPKHMLYLIDVCYGGLAKSRSMSNAFIQNVWDMNSREIITAGTGDETVIESPEWQHSVFTKVFLDAFNNNTGDTNEDDIISTAELFGYIQQRVPYYAKNKGGKQTPQYSFLTPDDGTFLFELSNGALANTSKRSTVPTNEEEIANKFKSKLFIKSNVDNARVFINGEEDRFISDYKGEYLLSPGFYRVELKRDKHNPVSKEILVQPDTSSTVTFNLESSHTVVNFIVQPEDAAVLIDNELVGTGHFITEVPKGRHTLTIEKAGYRSVSNILNLTMNQTSFTFDLEKILAKVEFKTIPSGALIIDKNDTLGTTPLTTSLAHGRHSVVFYKKNYQPKILDVNITESALLRYNELMEMEPEFLAAKEANKMRIKSFGGFVINGGLAYAGYYGYQYFDSVLKEIEMKENAVPAIKDQQTDSKDLYLVGKYGSIGLGAIFAISSVTKLIKGATITKKRILRKNFSESITFDFQPKRNGGQIAMHVNL